jgi:hypothetical protein
MSDTSFTSPAVVIGDTGQNKIVQNMGAKRILGTSLIALGKVPQYAYYLVDISSMCFWANDGTNTWIGGFGHVVAGNQTQRESLTPFETQKFYDVDTDISYEYKGGLWSGGVVAANVLAATYLELTGATTLTRGRSHVIVTSGDYTLPVSVSPTLGNTQVGHKIEVVVARGVVAYLLSHITEAFINDEGPVETIMQMAAGNLYTLVFNGTKWEVYAVDLIYIASQIDSLFTDKMDKSANLGDVVSPAAARANIDVYSKLESVADTDAAIDNQIDGNGITKVGSSAAGTVEWSVDFASPADALNPAIDNKAITPATIAVAVSAAVGASQFNNITGLAPKDTEVKFELTANVNRTLVDHPEFTIAFNTDPYLRNDLLTKITVPAGSVLLPNTAGVVTHRVVVSNLGVITFNPTKPATSSVTEILLGTVVALNGEVLSSGGVDQIIDSPWLSSSEYNVRNDATSIAGDIIIPSATLGKVTKSRADLHQEGANWVNSTLTPHTVVIPAQIDFKFSTLDRNGAFIASGIDEVTGRFDDLGAGVGANNWTIQLVYQATANLVVVLLGQDVFPTFADADNVVATYAPIIPTPLATALEISRWIVKGNQYPGSGFVDLGIATNFKVVSGASVSGAGSVSTASDIVSSNTQNTLSTTNLQTQIDELSDRTDWEWPVGGGLIDSSGIVATDATAFTLPVVPQAGIEQRLAAIGGISATFNTSGGGNNITSSNNKFPDDSQFVIEPADNGKIYTLISNGTKWVL